jgi:hypothetical protein
VPTEERGAGEKGVWHYWVGAGPGRKAWTRWWRRDYCWNLVDKVLECGPVERWNQKYADERHIAGMCLNTFVNNRQSSTFLVGMN